MLPALQNLVNNSVTFTGHAFDRRNLLYAYLLARTTNTMPLDYNSLTNLVSDYPGFNDEMFFNVQLYQLATNLGLGINGQNLIVTAKNALTGDGGLVDAGKVQNIIKYATLRRLGAI